MGRKGGEEGQNGENGGKREARDAREGNRDGGKGNRPKAGWVASTARSPLEITRSHAPLTSRALRAHHLISFPLTGRIPPPYSSLFLCSRQRLYNHGSRPTIPSTISAAAADLSRDAVPKARQEAPGQREICTAPEQAPVPGDHAGGVEHLDAVAQCFW